MWEHGSADELKKSPFADVWEDDETGAALSGMGYGGTHNVTQVTPCGMILAGWLG